MVAKFDVMFNSGLFFIMSRLLRRCFRDLSYLDWSVGRLNQKVSD